MANEELVALVKQGPGAWNAWRLANPQIPLGKVDLSGANLIGADLIGADLIGADLREANLVGAHLRKANLSRADLSNAFLHDADLKGADLSKANLSFAKLNGADMMEADLQRVNFSSAYLVGARLSGANLERANLSGTALPQSVFAEANLTWAIFSRAHFYDTDLSNAKLWLTTFGDNDLSTVKGLETVIHEGPSIIGIETLFNSGGKIPDVFLRGAGVPETLITQLPALIASIQPIQFHSCFISYSHQDEEFSQRLHSQMRAEKLRVWYAPEDMKGGRKLHEEIFSAIQIHDKLLLVLSESSMKSEWVLTEIRRARKVEREEHRRKLFPIRLIDFEAIQKWECFDADSGKDLAVEVREYYIPDFSNWKDHESFEKGFARLLRDLKTSGDWP
jgi:uncharacterized protein YjbI with pentapeptide repeats